MLEVLLYLASLGCWVVGIVGNITILAPNWGWGVGLSLAKNLWWTLWEQTKRAVYEYRHRRENKMEFKKPVVNVLEKKSQI